MVAEKKDDDEASLLAASNGSETSGEDGGASCVPLQQAQQQHPEGSCYTGGNKNGVRISNFFRPISKTEFIKESNEKGTPNTVSRY